VTSTQLFNSLYNIELIKSDKGLFRKDKMYNNNFQIPKIFEIEDNCFITINKDKFFYNFPKLN